METKCEWKDKLYKIVFEEERTSEFPEPFDYQESIDFVFSTLPQNQHKAFILRCRDNRKLSEIAEFLDVTTERARRLSKKALEKLRNPENSDILKFGLKKYYEKIEEETKDNIEKSGLSARTNNCLKRAGIKNKNDLLVYIKENGGVTSLLNLHYLGTNTFKEITKILDIVYV